MRTDLQDHTVPKRIAQAIGEMETELQEARLAYPAFASSHEGYSVILEELDELWDAIKAPPDERSSAAMRTEATQVAARAIRFVIDICDQDVL